MILPHQRDPSEPRVQQQPNDIWMSSRQFYCGFAQLPFLWQLNYLAYNYHLKSGGDPNVAWCKLKQQINSQYIKLYKYIIYTQMLEHL